MNIEEKRRLHVVGYLVVDFESKCSFLSFFSFSLRGGKSVRYIAYTGQIVRETPLEELT